MVVFNTKEMGLILKYLEVGKKYTILIIIFNSITYIEFRNIIHGKYTIEKSSVNGIHKIK